MAVLTNKFINGHGTPSLSTTLRLAFPLARELFPFFFYLGNGPFTPLHSLSYFLIFRRRFFTATHFPVPLGYGSGVIAHHALGQLTVGKYVFINIPVCFLYGKSGEYPLELAAATTRTRWWGHREALPIRANNSATGIAPILINRHFPLPRKF